MRPLVLMLVLAGCQETTKPAPPPPPPSATPAPKPKLVLPAPSDPHARLKAPEPPPPQPARPDPSLDWLLEAKAPLKRADLLRAFDETWRREHDLVRIYGWRAGAPLLITDDSGDAYERVTVAMQLLKAAGDDDLRTVAAPHLATFLAEATARLRKAGAVEVSAPATPADGAAAAIRLKELFMANGCEITLRLLSPDGHPFDSKRVLDVLLSLGLLPDDQGAVEFAGFEVKTRTPPGRLDPGALLDGKLQPTSLIFELYVPHAAHPVESWALLIKAADYAQRRLGGRRELLMEDFGTAHATDEKAARARVAGIAAALEKAGFPAGAPSTSRLFALP